MKKKMDEIAGQLTPDDLLRNRQAFLAPTPPQASDDAAVPKRH
jgi:hypothetical protein